MLAPAAESDMQRIIREISARGDFPAAARVIERLRTTVARESCTALDVARIILADPGTASKVLRLVNSAFYRKAADPVSTVTRAVVVMGFQAIRDLTTGVVLMEQLVRHGPASAVVRDGLRCALLSGLLAQRLAPAAGYPNAEEAYLLGLFAEFGLLWLATYYPADLDRALAVADERGVPIAVAVREVFGDRPEVLSAAILEHWDFPASFAEHFRHPPAASSTEVASPAAKLSTIVHVAAEYARVLEGGPESAAPVLDRCERLLGLRPEQVVAAGQAASEALREQAIVLGLGVSRAQRGSAPPRSSAAPAPTPRPVAARAGDAADTLALVAEITRSIVEQRDINEVLLMVLEGVARTGRFDAVFLVLLTRERDRLVGRLGYGDGVEEFLASLAAPVQPGGGVLAEVVLGRVARVVPDAALAPLVAVRAPAPGMTIASFIACPVVVRGRCVGVLVAARAQPPPVAEADLPTVELFCNQTAVALHQYAR